MGQQEGMSERDDDGVEGGRSTGTNLRLIKVDPIEHPTRTSGRERAAQGRCDWFCREGDLVSVPTTSSNIVSDALQ